MTDIPRDDHLESSLALLGEGYPFIAIAASACTAMFFRRVC